MSITPKLCQKPHCAHPGRPVTFVYRSAIETGEQRFILCAKHREEMKAALTKFIGVEPVESAEVV